MGCRRTPDGLGEAPAEEPPQEPVAAIAPLTGTASDTESPSVTPSPSVGQCGREARDAAAAKIINRYTIWAAALAVIPLPVIDVLLATGHQIKMLSLLATTYGVEFSERAGRAMITALLSASGVSALKGSLLTRAIRGIPVAGWIAGSLVGPFTGGAVTYAVGRVFAQHFAGGGTMLNFDADEFKESFREEYQRGLALIHRGRNSGHNTETAD